MITLFACTTAEPVPKATPEPLPSLGPADAVGAADFDQDGSDEIVLFNGGTASWLNHEASLGGDVQAIARGDGVLYVGVGSGLQHREAPAAVWALSKDGATKKWSQPGPRNQVTDLRWVGGQLWVSHFRDQWSVAGGFLKGTDLDVQTVQHMGLRQVPTDQGIVVGRLYGDEPRSDGDLRLVGDTTRTLPSLRGVRSLAVGDLNNDAKPELLAGDGWHSHYGEQADPRIILFDGRDWKSPRTVGWMPDDYTVRELHVLETGLFVAVGTNTVMAYRLHDLGWVGTQIASVAETGWAVPLRIVGAWHVAVSGEPATIVPL